MTNWEEFSQAVSRHHPASLLVLGSGLAEVADAAEVLATVGFGAIPGLVPPTVQGHKGQLSLVRWDGVYALISIGRVHGYEGHPLARVTRIVNLAADFGISTVILTNAAGGIRPDLVPGQLMPLRAHLKLLDSQAWRRLGELTEIYQTQWVNELASDCQPGVYAALTGPCYETPAEIRALRQIGADAVGMSTALEAEAAHQRGLSVIGLSCITNKAAGLGDGHLSHAEVEQNAKLALDRLRLLLPALLNCSGLSPK